MLSVRTAATLSPTAAHSQDFHAVSVLGWTWTYASDCVMWRLTTSRTALNKNCNVEWVGEMSSHCWPNLPPTVSSFAWWIIYKSFTLRILVSCSSKVPLRLLDLNFCDSWNTEPEELLLQNSPRVWKLQSQKENRRKKTLKTPHRLFSWQETTRNPRLRSCFPNEGKRRERVQKIRVSMFMSSSNKVELLTARVVAQIHHNRAPLGHCWQTFARGLQIGGCYVCPHCWSIRSLASFRLTVTTSFPFTQKTHLFSPSFQPIFLSFVLKLRLLSLRHQRSSLFHKSSSINETKFEPMLRVPRQSSRMLPSLYALFAKQAFSHARLTSPSVSPGQVPYLHLEASCRETRSRVSPCLGHPWFSRAGMRTK